MIKEVWKRLLVGIVEIYFGEIFFLDRVGDKGFLIN